MGLLKKQDFTGKFNRLAWCSLFGINIKKEIISLRSGPLIVSLAGCPAIVVRVSLTNNLFSIHRVRHLLGDRINDSFKKTGDIISKNKEQIEVTFVIKQLHYIYFVVLIAKGDGSLEREGKRIKVLPFS